MVSSCHAAASPLQGSCWPVVGLCLCSPRIAGGLTGTHARLSSSCMLTPSCQCRRSATSSPAVTPQQAPREAKRRKVAATEPDSSSSEGEPLQARYEAASAQRKRIYLREPYVK